MVKGVEEQADHGNKLTLQSTRVPFGTFLVMTLFVFPGRTHSRILFGQLIVTIRTLLYSEKI